MKIIPFLITGFLLALVSLISYAVLLNSLSEFTAKQAQPGIILFVGAAIVITLTTAIVSGLAANYFIEKKDWSLAVASLVSIALFFVVGTVVMIVGLAITIAVADYLRF